MKKSYAFLTFATSLLFLVSCQKDELVYDQTPSSVHLTSQQKLDNLSPPMVLFQYSLLNLETRQETGWIIDRSGLVKTYQTTWPADKELEANNENWHETDLANLYALASETVGSVGVDELLPRVYQGFSLSKKFLSTTQTNDQEKWLAGYYSFSPQDESAGNYHPSHYGGCSVGTMNYNTVTGNSSETIIKRQIVHLSGYLNRYETSNYAIDLHQWLMQENDKL